MADKCALPFLDPSGHLVFFDVQSAEPGTFTVPGVIDLEVYEPGSMVETSWIYFKGDPQAGPQPGHPFERPFNNSAKFSIDLVRDDDTSKALREILRESSYPDLSQLKFTDKPLQLPPILLRSGKAAHHSGDRVTTQCTSRDSTAHASTISSAR